MGDHRPCPAWRPGHQKAVWEGWAIYWGNIKVSCLRVPTTKWYDNIILAQGVMAVAGNMLLGIG